MIDLPPPYCYLHLDMTTGKWTVHDEPGHMRVAVWTKNLIAATTAAGLVDGKFLALLDKHRRHVELSPGVGADVQTYALAVIQDIRIDVEAAIGREVTK